MGFLELFISVSHIGLILYWIINVVSLFSEMFSGDVSVLDALQEIARGIVVVAVALYAYKKYSGKVKSKKITSNSVLRFAVLFVLLDILSV